MSGTEEENAWTLISYVHGYETLSWTSDCYTKEEEEEEDKLRDDSWHNSQHFSYSLEKYPMPLKVPTVDEHPYVRRQLLGFFTCTPRSNHFNSARLTQTVKGETIDM